MRVFFKPPVFNNVTNVAQIDFSGTHVGFALPGKRSWTSDSKIPIRLRALRKIAEETKNYDLDRDLYIEERKAERGVYLRQQREELRQRLDELKKASWREWPLNAGRLIVPYQRLIAHLLWIAIMGVYWALADYGRSFVRPFAWLIASVFFFYMCYSEVLAPLMAKAARH